MSVALCQRDISGKKYHDVCFAILKYNFIHGVPELSLDTRITHVITDHDGNIDIDGTNMISSVKLPNGISLSEVFEPIIYK